MPVVSARFLKGPAAAAPRPRPRDCAAVLVVVVGGVTFAELRAVREAWSPADDGESAVPPVRRVAHPSCGRHPLSQQAHVGLCCACVHAVIATSVRARQLLVMSNCVTGPERMYRQLLQQPGPR